MDVRAANAVTSPRVKSDKADAYALAEMVRIGWYRAVHVKSEASHRLKAMLGARDQLVRAKRALGNEVRGLLGPFAFDCRRGRGPRSATRRRIRRCGAITCSTRA